MKIEDFSFNARDEKWTFSRQTAGRYCGGRVLLHRDVQDYRGRTDKDGRPIPGAWVVSVNGWSLSVWCGFRYARAICKALDETMGHVAPIGPFTPWQLAMLQSANVMLAKGITGPNVAGALAAGAVEILRASGVDATAATVM